ncbi:MAG TPA: hypothetical protein VKR06_03400 [Ktedonosporobacter sp.]|nr:hypothetical protein [Ktedonosporobacter sp.]
MPQNYHEVPARRTTRSSLPVTRKPAPKWAEPDDDVLYNTRPNTSTRRYLPAGAIPLDVQVHDRRSRKLTYLPAPHTDPYEPAPETEPLPRKHRKRRKHPMFYAGVGMMLMLLFWIGGSMLLNWWSIWQDDIHYGRPRTFSTDAVVGHQDSASHPSHFIALNLNRHIQIIEIPGGDAAHTRVYSGPILYGDRDDLMPVLISFSGGSPGHPDMVISIGNQRMILHNDGTQFVLSPQA